MMLNPSNSYNYATPDIGVEIYPHGSNQSFSFIGSKNGILSATVQKNIRDRNGGKFTINVAPGGPQGVASKITWTSVINPMSLVIIYLSRANSKRIVMIGVVTNIKETQVWTNKQVKRVIQINGFDFTYYFNVFSYYQLSYLGLLTNQEFTGGSAGYIFSLYNKIAQGPPNYVAAIWLLDVMLGTGSKAPSKQAVLSNTFLTYQGNNIFLNQLLGYWFEAFNQNSQNIYLPVLADLMNSEGTWLDIFLYYLAWPFYEFFIITGNETDYPGLANSSNINSITGTSPPPSTKSFSSIPSSYVNVQGFNKVYPLVIGRLNPQPWTTYPTYNQISTGAGGGKLSTDKWDNLNTYNLNPYSFISSEIFYDLSDVGNFFGINTLDSATLAQGAGTAVANLTGFELLGGILDHSSINQYGYRPKWANLRWLTSIIPISTSSQVANVQLIAQTLLGIIASFYIPTPNMLQGTVIIPMWPEVMPGNKFIYKPYKNMDDYEFYIEGVSHTYQFGEQSTTTLNLSRGLKLSDYNNASILQSSLLDNSIQVDGQLTTRSDLKTNLGGYYINAAEVSKIPATATAYYSMGEISTKTSS